jgi:sortase (surface protein transpeptidase)
MAKSCINFLFLIALIAPLVTTADSVPANSLPSQLPAPSNSALPSSSATPVSKPNTSSVPVRLLIPAIGLDDPIVSVGLTESNAMDVPSGKTNNVGWLSGGPKPGAIGSAVLDAHVFAAFARLKDVPVGSDIYVLTEAGTELHFIVRESLLYKLSELSPDLLFGRNDARRLNLITCAGQLTPDHSTYDHRLVLFAELAS